MANSRAIICAVRPHSSPEKCPKGNQLAPEFVERISARWASMLDFPRDPSGYS
jgi:hypothetical protein